MPAFPTALFQQAHRPDRNSLFRSFAHVVERKCRDSHGRHGFHLDSRFGFGPRNSLDTRAAVSDIDRNVEMGKR